MTVGFEIKKPHYFEHLITTTPTTTTTTLVALGDPFPGQKRCGCGAALRHHNYLKKLWCGCGVGMKTMVVVSTKFDEW